ncbi:MAG: tetratricopeptide repeat protein [Rhodoferax sp.]|nr:tetratricopeptide repeat protein [Rhodoferax sp.]
MTIELSFERQIELAWQGELDFNALIACASRLEAAGRSFLAIVLYRTWIARNASELEYIVQFNLGVALSNAGDLAGSESAYRRAVELAPGFIQPRLNLGTLLERLGKVDQALDEWRWVEKSLAKPSKDNKPLLVMALNQLGRVLEMRKQLAEATAMLTRSLELEPEQPDVLHHWISLRQKQCAWPTYGLLPGVSRRAMQDATSALSMLSISDDPADQLAAARRFVKKKLRSEVPKLADVAGYGHKRIRIGYCSGDFCLHPVSLLTVELFELHDRERFEVYGYCWSPEDGTPMRQRVINAMDHFTRIDVLSDEAAAERIRADEIDVLIDLQGQTAGARATMLAYRPAPVQITYLGLPATTGLPSIDYVIADRFLIPESEALHYSERPLYMPDVYQVSDRQRPVGPKPSRAQCALPSEGFVFCSFNNNYKFTPEVFAVWMNILRRVPASVLWLLGDNQWSMENLRKEAAARGVDPQRLIFAPRVSPEIYLARYQVADLFLDSFPFNAGTTANDALWMELPLLTLCGRSFASRMAGALLTAAGLHSLITHTLNDYEEMAVELANRPDQLADLRDQLKSLKTEGALFDTPRFVRNLESSLETLLVS